MKKTIFMIVLVILLATLACGSTDTTSDDSTIGSDVLVTEVPADTESGTMPDSPWYLDEFNTNLDNWSEVYITNATETEYQNETDVAMHDGGLWFDINLPDTYIYMFNNLYDYEDVQIEVEVSNTGRNSNYISLVCRYNEDMGWYEFNIAGSGEVSIYRYDIGVGYTVIGNGGSEAIRQGTATNTFTSKCEGNELTLTINGDTWRTFTDNKFTSGLIGISAGTMKVTPVQVTFNWMEITEP